MLLGQLGCLIIVLLLKPGVVQGRRCDSIVQESEAFTADCLGMHAVCFHWWIGTDALLELLQADLWLDGEYLWE